MQCNQQPNPAPFSLVDLLDPTAIETISAVENLNLLYTEAKADVTQEIEQRAQQAAQAGADHCALCSISCVTSTLASLYGHRPNLLEVKSSISLPSWTTRNKSHQRME